MIRDWLRRWLTLGTSLGAIIGLVLVVVQLEQTREMMRAQMRHDLAMGIVELLNSAAENSQLAGVLRRGGAGEELTADEHYQFRARTNALFRYWEDVHYQYRQGLYDQDEFSKHKEAWRAYLAVSKGAISYWCEVRLLYSPKFAAEMDALLPSRGCLLSPEASNNSLPGRPDNSFKGKPLRGSP